MSFGNLAGAQPAAGTDPSLDPHLFLTLKDFEARKAIAQREPWAKAALAGVVKEADGYPQDYLNEFGLTKVEAPKTAQWAHWYVCPETGTHLQSTHRITISAQTRARAIKTGRSAMCTITTCMTC